MTRRLELASFLILCTASAAHAQFELYALNGSAQQPVPPVYHLGSFYQNEMGSARFRLLNTSANRVTVFVLTADGAGFALSGVPPLPIGLDTRAALDFTVTFQSANTGSYSAALRSEGISVLLTATVLPRLTVTTNAQPLGTAATSFGTVERGGSSVLQFTIENLTPLILTVPAISVQGSAFGLVGTPPSGIVLQTRQSAGFEIRFTPPAAGTHTGQLTIGDRSYGLAGTSTEPALPEPTLSVDLPQPQSAQQGTVIVRLDAASRTSGTGTVTLEFSPLGANATDPGVAFAAGGLTVPFTVSPGDTQPLAAPFQTGTTAGTLIFIVALGGATDRQTVTIPAAPIGISSASATRSSGAIEVRVAGFDNSRTAGQISYTFYDAAGAAIAPGAVRVDSAAEFGRFFQTSDAGGNFLLRAVFPVTGDTASVTAFEVELTNSAGTTKTPRTLF